MPKSLAPRVNEGVVFPGRGQCTATAKRSGNQCRQPAVAGATVCTLHGGNAPQVRGKAAERLAEKAARQYLGDRVFEPMADPIDAILRLASEAWAMKDRAAAMVEKLDDEIRYKGATGEQLRAELAFYERMMDRCAKMAVDIQRLDLAERQTRIKEDQAVMVLALIDRVMDQLELSPAQKIIAGQVIPLELEAVEAPRDRS